ncbi:class I SAM-dependent methyltransferase [Comamonas antarctica]|uniref:class I SAM-dependent methyltransferase n=1 Tax=Comamonas antarctica TaxID=2743470 RepID=UPI0028F00777|nr:class I SAM-dependent methyltransferase [Comamonas antarctica]
MTNEESIRKFDPSRAREYGTQSRIALAGYDACHELAACLLSAQLGAGPRRVLVGGAGGTGQEIIAIAGLQPDWQFVAADPAQAMLEAALQRIAHAGLAERVQPFAGTLQALPPSPPFDAATLIGVLHHLPSQHAKQEILQAVAQRLLPGAPFILACNRCAYASQPLFLAAWAERWRMVGAGDAEVRAKLGKIRAGAVPPASETEVETLLRDAGFAAPARFFSSLFWSAWIAFRQA